MKCHSEIFNVTGQNDFLLFSIISEKKLKKKKKSMSNSVGHINITEKVGSLMLSCKNPF